MKGFGYGIFFGLGGTIGGMVVCLLALSLFWPDRMPAPAIARVVHVDEKLRFIRQRPEIDPNILAVGSSITWRNLSGAAFAEVAGGERHFLNGGVVHIRMHQIRKLAHFYLRNFHDVKTLLVLAGPPDFEDCTNDQEPILDEEGAAGYVFEHYPSMFYYFRYFSPQRYLRTVMTLPNRRTKFTGDLYIDEFGSGPVKLPPDVDLGLRYDDTPIDEACVDELIALSRDISDRSIQLMIVFTPIHPEYRARYPEAMHAYAGMVDRAREGVKGDGTRILALYDDDRFSADDFYDAFHLQWPGAQQLSAGIAAQLDQRDNSPVPGTVRKPQISRKVSRP